jgi:RimJ/RimL family protein N-acetyltransferase
MEIFRTERLIAKEATEDDASFIFRLVNNPTWIKNIGDRNIHNLEDAKMYIRDSLINSYRDNGFGMYIISKKNDGEALGLCGFLKREELDHVDIGFAILPEFAGKGYTYEAARVIVETSSFETVYGITSEGNLPSRNLLQKLGMRHVRNFQFGDYQEESMLYSNGPK